MSIFRKLKVFIFWCGVSGEQFLSEKEALEVFVKYSPKNVRELKLCFHYNIKSKLLPEELESFLIIWSNRIPQRSLSLKFITCYAYGSLDDEQNKKIIEKYIKLGVIKFKVIEGLSTSEEL